MQLPNQDDRLTEMEIRDSAKIITDAWIITRPINWGVQEYSLSIDEWRTKVLQTIRISIIEPHFPQRLH